MATAAEPSSITVRRATLSDAARLALLSGQLGYASTPEQVVTRLRDILADPERAVFVAEQKTSEISGLVDVFIMRTVSSEPRAEIAGLVVDEACRSQGVGRLLMARAEEWAREKCCAAVTLRSNVIREGAHRFYENLGYQLIKTQKSFRKDL